jgi:transposase
MDKYIGMDVDINKTVCCIISGPGDPGRYQTIATDVAAMQEFLRCEREGGYKTHVVFEVRGEAGWFYDNLEGCADEVVVCNPAKATWIYRTSKKNDKIDARKLAILLMMGVIPRVHMPPKKIRDCRCLILHRRVQVGRVTGVKSRIKAVLRSQGFGRPAHKGSWWKQVNREWMREVSTGGIEIWRIRLSDELAHLEMMESQVRSTTQRLDAYLADQAGGKLLMSIPGVGPRTAEAVLSYTDDVKRFDSSKEFFAYFGMTPKLDESGSCRRVGHISKKGPSVVRWLLCESSWIAKRKSPSLKAFFDRVTGGQPKRRKVANVAVGRKLLSIMRAMLMTGEVFNETLVGRICAADMAA